MKTPPHIVKLRLQYNINLHTKIYPHALIHKIPSDAYNTPLHYYVYIKLYLQHSFTQDIHLSFNSQQTKKIIISYIIMSTHITILQGGCTYPKSISEHGHFWPQTNCPKASDRYLKHQKISEVLLVDNHPKKRVIIEKGSLFDLLPVEIPSNIDARAIIFKCNNKRINVMNQTIQKNMFYVRYHTQN